ncbi:MAG: hypothetical protein ACRDFB_08600, partial [Rhabdochlamydiaceae bacterium]
MAKLLATENIIIQHLPTETAYFNLKDRILVCPVWKDDMGPALYDRLLGHEVSHALHTPLKGWDDMLKNHEHLLSIIQVVEDVRVDKLIVRRYPGLRKPFIEANKILFYEKDFFDTKRLDGHFEILNLVDRINIDSKVGALAMIKFKPEEQDLVNRIKANDDWKNVVMLAQELYDFIDEEYKGGGNGVRIPIALNEEQLKELLEELKENPDMLEEFVKAAEDYIETASPDIREKLKEMMDPEDSFDIDGDTQSDSFADGPNKEFPVEDAKGGGDDKTKIESVTDKAYRRNEKQLIENDSLKISAVVNMYLPEVILNNAIVPSKKIVNSLIKSVNLSLGNNYNCDYYDLALFLKSSFEKHNKKYISMLVKEFEMRKNASQYARQRESKIGELDTRKIYRYKFSDDIFRRMVTVDKGKSHGMIMFIDFSGSMGGVMNNVMEQLLILVSFCKKVNIPFDVY